MDRHFRNQRTELAFISICQAGFPGPYRTFLRVRGILNCQRGLRLAIRSEHTREQCNRADIEVMAPAAAAS